MTQPPEKIKYLKQSAADRLKKAVAEKNIAAYGEENPDWIAVLGDDFARPSSIEIVGDALADRIRMPKGKIKKGEDNDDAGSDDRMSDIANCLAVYDALNNLTPQQAADERVWLYLTHITLWDYVRIRWPLPENEDEKVKQIKLHYLVPTQRGLIRNNAIARLWWMGHVAHRCRLFKPEKALRILLYKSDVRANLLERPSLAASEEIFNAVMKILAESFDETKEMFERDNFRTLMKHLNRVGGRRMLNALGDNMLLELTRQMNPL